MGETAEDEKKATCIPHAWKHPPPPHADGDRRRPTSCRSFCASWRYRHTSPEWPAPQAPPNYADASCMHCEQQAIMGKVCTYLALPSSSTSTSSLLSPMLSR